MRAVVALAAAATLAAGCAGAGGGAGATHAATDAPRVTALPSSGTVTYTDGRVYTIAPAGSTVKLADIGVRVVSVRWAATVRGARRLPGTHTFAVVTLAVTNRTHTPQAVGGTQVWLLDRQRRAFLASPTARVAHPLLGAILPAGKAVTGTLVYAVPRRTSGDLLVYAFADAAAIAKAHHVGLLAFR